MRNGANPFRELIPMSQTQPFLQHIIIAVSAIHYSRAMNYESRLTSQCSLVANSALIDALCARQKAIQELRGALERQRTLGENDDPAEKDALLATVLFFVNFALIDSGKDGWRDHLRAAGRLLSAQGSINFFTMLPSSDASGLPVYMRPSLIDGAGTSLTKTIRTDQSTLSGLILLSKPLTACDYVASDTAAYYIWNNALDSLASSAQSLDSDTEASEWDPSNVLNILLRTETNSYHSCPARLMYIVLRASRLAQANKSNGTGGPDIAQREACLDLLNEAQSFDVDDWAKAVCARNVNFLDTTDEVELACRRCIAATYRAAVCLYILLVAQGLQAQTRWDTRYADNESLPFLPTTADLVTTILHQLSFIPKESPFFKFTTWPVFLTGVETASPARRAWVLDRLQAMRDICPWGMLTSAMETLADIWRLRDSVSPKAGVKVGAAHVSEDEVEAEEALDTSGWLVRLQSMKIDCLIV
ncbi:Uu.00g139340.m01.CDS01 [Anthostomella pinea]|uniref:Uu.00g139340.m01.CDS01 n=1 Tax=Anthostomella pinea TaxID=933095 RepID=A0AAI8VQS9_9PEZI|nr:Uu.00g139340.m01.CDS01 [Anthostomella pinea]